MLFLDTDDQRFFPSDARRANAEICEATDREVRKLLPMLADEIELAVQTGTRVIPEDGRRWIGYRAGVYIVDQARQKTGLSAAQLVRASTSEVLGLAGIGLPNT